MHISKLDYPYRKTVCVVGKGPSCLKWADVVCDDYISCNDAITLVRKGIFIQRDVHYKLELPAEAVAILPKCTFDNYERDYWYHWEDIPKLCTAATAVYVAYMIGAEKILMIGFDALFGNYSYGISNADNRNTDAQWAMRGQDKQFAGLPEHIMNITQIFNKGEWHALRSIVCGQVDDSM